MATSTATSVAEYLASVPDEWRPLVAAIRDTVNANLPDGYAEGMQWGMIGWFVPHERYPAGYHTDPKQPLPLASLASQKQYVSLYLLGVYCDCDEPGSKLTPDAVWFRDAWTATGARLDMGRSCVRVRKLDDIPLDAVGEAIRRVPVDSYVERYEAARPAPRKGKR